MLLNKYKLVLHRIFCKGLTTLISTVSSKFKELKLIAVHFDNNSKRLITCNSQQWTFLSLLRAVLYQGISIVEEVGSNVYTPKEGDSTFALLLYLTMLFRSELSVKKVSFPVEQSTYLHASLWGTKWMWCRFSFVFRGLVTCVPPQTL
jgi:hypothetical protein